VLVAFAALVLGGLGLAALVLAGCGGRVAAAGGDAGSPAPAGAPETAEITLIMDWVPWVLDIPVDVAQAQGFYAAHGLTVKQVLPASATDVVKFVSTGKAQFGLYYAPDTLTGAAEGAPLLSVAALMSQAPVGMALAPGVHASTPAGLAGKTAGVVTVPSTRASFETMLRVAGVDPSSVKVVDPGFDLVPSLLAGRYDAVAVTRFGELVQADREGRRLDFLDFRDWGTPDYAFLNIVTQQGFAQKDPATVRAFVAATTEGLSWAVAHPEEAVGVYVKRHPELRSDLLLAQWKAAIPSLAVAAGGHPAGWQDLSSWRALDTWMVKTGQIAGPADVPAVVSNAYLPSR
jgi:putative hydroxymethylpyrimidine transport system substrate-binding protein